MCGAPTLYAGNVPESLYNRQISSQIEGQLFDAIRAAVDSKGNVYVAETDWGRRVKKFKPMK